MNKHIYNENEYGSKEEIFENHENIYSYTFERIFDNEGIEIGKKFLYKDYTPEELAKFDQEKVDQQIIELRAELSSLDFKTTKQVEAFLAGNTLPYTAEEFKVIADLKQGLRDQINILEGGE